jgi:hypothetical protein
MPQPRLAGNGGTAAPGRARGRGRGLVNPRGRGMMNPPGQGATTLPQHLGGNGNGGTPAPNGRPGGGQGGGKAALGGQAMAGPGGRQLEARVQSGAITSQQAQKTMQQRQTLAKALGPNWRDKLQVGGKSFAQVNAGIKKNPGNAKLNALRKRLTTNRASLLEAARSKGKAAAGSSDGESGK